MLAHGKNLAWFESLEEQGETPPPEYYDRPMLYPDLHDMFKAFDILNNSRQAGFQASPIQISEILAYCKLFRIGEDELEYRELLTKRIQIMDKVYMDYQSKESKKKKGK